MFSQKTPSQMPIFVVTEFLHGFHKTIWGTTRNVKTLNSYFNKSLLRRSGCQGLREDNKRFFIMEKSYYYSFNVLWTQYLQSGSVNKNYWKLTTITNEIKI